MGRIDGKNRSLMTIKTELLNFYALFPFSPDSIKIRITRKPAILKIKVYQSKPRSKLTGYQICSAANCRAADARIISQISAGVRLFDSLLAGIKEYL